MGKAQSKRSVDITTENKEGAAVAEGESGKVGKIEDVDQKPQLNGDANKEADSGVSYCFRFVFPSSFEFCYTHSHTHIYARIPLKKSLELISFQNQQILKLSSFLTSKKKILL